MMRPSLLILLAALHLLISITQGIRIDSRGLIKKSSPIVHEQQQQQHLMRNNINIDHGGGVDEKKFVDCKQGEKCTYPVPAGKSRKLMISITPPTTKTNTAEDINGSSEPKVINSRKEKDGHVSSDTRSLSPDSAYNQHREVVVSNNNNVGGGGGGGDDQYYNDTVEILTEMDYSSAQRKPPIHN